MFNPLKRSGKKKAEPKKEIEPIAKKILKLNDEEVAKTEPAIKEEVTKDATTEALPNEALKVATEAIIKPEQKNEISKKDDVKNQATEALQNNANEEIPTEYRTGLPASLSQDLADLAKMTAELTQKGAANKTGLLGIFQTEDEPDATEDTKELNTKKDDEQASKKTSVKEAGLAEKEPEATKKKEVSTEETNPANKVSDEKGSAFSFLQFSTFLKQQKSLLQKLAKLGNTPIFDPEKFNQLLKAAPAILAWQKAGSPVPNGASGKNTTANTNQTGSAGTSSTAPSGAATPKRDDEFGELTEAELENSESTEYEKTIAIQRENKAEIEKNMGIEIESSTKSETETKPVDAKAMAETVDSEGFLESTVAKEVEAPITVSNGIMAEEVPQKSDAQLEKERKAQLEQEKAWEEEAKRRQKMLDEKRKEAKANEGKKKYEKVTIQMPKKERKMGFMANISHKIAFFGLGKLKDEFIDNLGVMMDAGLPLLDALHTLEMETKVKPYKKILTKVVVAVETGSPLWRAMESTYFFEGQQIAMIKVGEQAGNLVENLRYLAEQSAKQRELKAKVKTAMIYPIIVGVMLTLIIFGLGMFVLPNLIQVIYSLGVPLPLITRIIVSFTNLFSEHGTVLLPSVIGGFFLLLTLHKYTSFNVVTQFIVMKIPGIGTLVRESVLSQFGVTVGGLLQAGVPITDALESLANVTTIAKYKKFYYVLLQRIRLGDSFATAFANIKNTDKCFPTSMQQLIKTGEKSGSLTHIMMKISDIHEKKASDVAEKLPVILEPMLLMFIGTLVGGIALGVLAPIYSIVGNVG